MMKNTWYKRALKEKKQAGIALLMVLGSIALLSGIVVEFA